MSWFYTEEASSKTMVGSAPWWTSHFFLFEPRLFGTWDGVFTSCLLNIFGVIIFIRTGKEEETIFSYTTLGILSWKKKNNRINEINKTDQIVGSKKYTITKQKELEAFSVHDRRTGFIVFLLRNPHLLEGGKRRQDGSTDPDGVFSLGRRDDLDLHGRRR